MGGHVFGRFLFLSALRDGKRTLLRDRLSAADYPLKRSSSQVLAEVFVRLVEGLEVGPDAGNAYLIGLDSGNGCC